MLDIIKNQIKKTQSPKRAKLKTPKSVNQQSSVKPYHSPDNWTAIKQESATLRLKSQIQNKLTSK